MTIRAVLSCNGNEGMYECRQATPVGEVLTAREARAVAAKIHGWTSQMYYVPSKDTVIVQDYCKSCTKRRLEGK